MTIQKPDILKQAERLAQGIAGRFPARLSFRALRRGHHGQRKSGTGDDFWQFRDYQTGDSARSVDWKQSAKTDRIFLREQETSLPQTLYFYRSFAESMEYASRPRIMKKKDYADILWLALAYMALKAGEHVFFSGAHRIVSRPDMLAEEYQHMHQATEINARNTQAVIFSDFCQDIEEVKSFFDALAAQNIGGVVVHISDPAEMSFPFSGHVILHDNGLSQTEISAAQSIRERYQEKFAAHQSAISDYAQRKGFLFVSIVTDKPLPGSLSHLVQLLTGDSQ